MKSIIRTFVVALTLTGAAAIPATSSASHSAILAARSSFMPVASCPPNDPNACGVH